MQAASSSKPKRSVTKKARFEVFKRDSYICQYCGSHPPNSVLELDHVIPVSKGGNNEIDNLITSCFDCNRGKGATPLTKISPTLAEKSARLEDAEEQIRAYYHLMEEKNQRIEIEAFTVADIFDTSASISGFRKDRLRSIKMFINKLDFYEVKEAMEIAVGKRPQRTYKTFSYFCGICWNRIKERQDA